MRASPLFLCVATSSALLLTPNVVPRSSVKMQYGQQQGYGQQQSYGGQQMQQGGYGGGQQQQQGTWHIFPRDGAASMIKTDYNVAPGQQQVLGRWDIDPCGNKPMVRIAEQQAVVQVGNEGTITVFAQGQTPTGVRSGPYEQWYWLQPGQSQQLAQGWKISLDCNDPDAAVFKCEIAGSGGAGFGSPSAAALQQQGGGYGGQQQGGYY